MHAFFSGLIPEEYTRKRVSDYLHISELSTIKLLAALGQECAGYISIADKDVYIVQRYDRIEADGKILRLHQEDMCQALGIITDQKYQADGGPSIKDIYQLVKENSIMPVLDLRAFITNVLFNYLIGNCDAHGKNYSILYDEKLNIRLSPVYNVVSTKVYTSLSRKLSMKIGSHYELEKIDEDDFKSLADDLKINPKIIKKILSELSLKLQDFTPFLTK